MIKTSGMTEADSCRPIDPGCHSRRGLAGIQYLVFFPFIRGALLTPAVIPAGVSGNPVSCFLSLHSWRTVAPRCHSRMVLAGIQCLVFCLFIRVALLGEKPLDSRLKMSGMTVADD